LALEKEEVVVYNLKEFKDRAADMEEHQLLAESVLQGLKENDLRLEVELQHPTLIRLRDKLMQDWQEHKQLSEKSGKASRIKDFSP
jgi:hypothetical protein